jgi:hypothetical protein
MTMLTKRLAAVAASAVPATGAFGRKRAGDRLAGGERARLDHPGSSFADPTRGADSSMMLRTLILAGVGFVALVVFLAWVMGGFAGLSGKGVVALTLGILFTGALGVGLMALVFFSDRSGRDDEVDRAGRR